MSNRSKYNFPILSFYSGGGFMDMGFEQAGFEIVWTNEYDEAFAKLHAAGITSWRKSLGNEVRAEIFNTKSILDITSQDIINDAFEGVIPDNFGIIGGPPCQDFTVHGNMEGFDGERGKLTIVFFDKILDLKPTFFLMENVPGLTKNKATKEKLLEVLEPVKKMYHIDYDILNALDFGVPQFRERIFFIGIRKDKIDEKKIPIDLTGKWFKWPENNNFRGAATKFKWPEAVKFGTTTIKPKNVLIELCVQSCLVSKEKQQIIPNANEYFHLHTLKRKLNSIKEGETNRPSFKRLHRYKYSPTACYGNNEVHLHPFEHRRLSVREVLRIQGVPDEYVLPMDLPLTKKFKMIGNGVPIPLAKAVAESLLSFIKDKKIIY
jgi:DNA (cytosine-5)-methyltransferase 1